MSDTETTIRVVFTERQKSLLLANSVERVINSSITVLQQHAASKSCERDVELADTALMDWIEDNEAMKWLVVKLWNEARNAVFIEKQQGHVTDG